MRNFDNMRVDDYIKEPARRTPGIVVSAGRICIMGRSIPDDPGVLFSPVLEKAICCVEKSDGVTKIDLGFEYINTTSTKWIFLIIRSLLEKVHVPGRIQVTWHFEEGDDDMFELGLMFRSLLECPFNLVEVQKMDQDLYNSILSSGT